MTEAAAAACLLEALWSLRCEESDVLPKPVITEWFGGRGAVGLVHCMKYKTEMGRR